MSGSSDSRGWPLTEAQSGLWYAQQLDPANPLFNTGQYIELVGALDPDAFRSALSTAVEEAEALSLRMIDAADGPRQFLDAAQRPSLDVIDVSGAEDPLAAAEADIARDMATPIDPTRDPLAAERLFRLGPERFIWQQRIHHLAIDGYGMILLTQRVADLYNARRRGTAPGPALPGLDVVLAEDAAYRVADKRAADAAYWREAFADQPEVASLAAGAPVSAFGFHRRAVEVDAATVARLHALAKATSIPWPDLLTALCAAYVQRHTGTAEVVLGVPHMGRLGSKAARVPAMLMNVLPVRVAPEPGATLADFLGTVARGLVKARRHGRYRSEQLRRDLKLIGRQRRLHGPLVNVLPFDETPHFEGLDARLQVLSAGPVDEITFTFRAHGDAGLRLEIDANPDLYSADEALAHARRLNAFLAAALAAERLDEVSTATPEEAQRHLGEMNATAHAVADVTLTALIETTMRHCPTAPAIRFDGAEMSYGELDCRSAALASRLAAAGAGPGGIVAVALPRSLELIVALVAVLRAGAAYLPLDLGHPDERLARILGSARPVVALALEADAGRFAPHVPVLAPEAWPSEPGGVVPPAAKPCDAAYVIYTSGSTGEPKGVVIEHRAIVNRLEWMREHYRIGPDERIVQKTPATFDVSVWEFFLPLIAGAVLVVAPPEAHRDPVALARLFRAEKVTTAHFVPSMLAAFLAEPAAQGLALRYVFCSGEELPAELRDRFHRTLAAELHNLYGPTEAAVDVSFWPAGPQDRARPVPIGFPVWNTRLYVLDEAMRPQPPGVPGHLFLAGVQLARGYLGRPDLTAERFLPDPFVPGERMYRSGDLAYYRTDGAVIFLGRSDHQIKIRGLRVELGEIETAVMQSGLVRQCAVIASRDAAGAQRIVAYVVGVTEAGALREKLASRLPDYMVPSAIVTLDALPVTANGKLDRAALPAPEFSGVGGRAPQTPSERLVARLFREVLRLEAEPAAEDDFFALGGDSLQAVSMLLRLREAVGRDPGLGALFAAPSVASLAAALDDQAAPAEFGLDPVIRLADGDPALPPLFAIHPAGGLAWCYGGLARTLAPRRAVYGLQAPALSPEEPLPPSLAALAADYARRIRTVRPNGPYHLVGWSVGGILAQAVAVELRQEGAEVGVVALLDAYPSDCWRAEAEPAPDAALKALLAIAGHDPDRLPGLALSRASVIAFLRASDSPLGTLSNAALDGVVRVVTGNNRLVRGHHHARYDGTLTFFRAALDHEGRDLTPAKWAPYAAGIEVIDIASLHAHLTGRAATAAIAPVLGEALAANEQSKENPCVTTVSRDVSPSSPERAEA
ncbi:non-ribosomal peptide synthetase [Ancylobacter oerskovii]|uniref:Non-ribosomal peptide synthetase n=1 Tax=Ancylobacter oerskovii TaxID=459519 RepID=A0ABW4YT69_9HYPH|nr:non-ribosomal peptide synthetase [Ancylobacter oerskovii]MBS7543498.1 amino acid adenylation domain-containing protein [Ancylobacter oerskovii]